VLEHKAGGSFQDVPVLDLLLLSEAYQKDYLRYAEVTDFELLPSTNGMFVLAETFIEMYESRLGDQG
jgi:hypothetical protein